MSLLLLFLLLSSQILARQCDDGWSYFNSHCYKHIMNWTNRVVYSQAQQQCADHDGWVTSIDSEEEMNFVVQLGLRPTIWTSKGDALKNQQIAESLRIGAETGNSNYIDFLLVGGYKDGNKQWHWNHSKRDWFKWCRYDVVEPSGYPREDCTAMQLHNPCIYDVYCDGDWRPILVPNGFSHFVCKKRMSCSSPDADPSSKGKCVCKEGFIDITKTNIPEASAYKPGEKCLSKTPCDVVAKNESLSVIFIIDSSHSIGKNNWFHIIKFLQSGASTLNNKMNVGFIKFATNVTSAVGLKAGWSRSKYLDSIPTDYDDGQTNTPEALDTATEMFKQDKSDHKIAVLITDGMPYVEDILEKDVAIPVTKTAANKLKNSGVDLIALGYGKELVIYSKYLRELLTDPENDYFQFDKEACDLTDQHMTILLNKVCRRY